MHVNLITAAMSLTGCAMAAILPSFSSTSTVTLYSPASTQSVATCSPCPNPKDWDRNWNADRVINDTREHHGHFKLFAYLLNFPEVRLPVHLQTHKNRKDMWHMKLSPEVNNTDHNKDQPKWNLDKGSLQTDRSEPIKDTLYFRLYDGHYPQDTEFWTGTVYHNIVTRHHNKATYEKEGDVKLVAKKGWELQREQNNPLAYVLKGTDPTGAFYACLEDRVAISDLDGALRQAQIIYTPAQLKKDFDLLKNPALWWEKRGCTPATIKAEEWPAPKQ